MRPMHRRRRSALTVCSAAALAAAMPLLTACGSDAHPGAAAVVQQHRISEGALQAKVGAVRDAQRSAPQSDQLIKGSGQLTRATLDGMIRDRIVERAARDAHVTVTRREVQKLRGQLQQQAGGGPQMAATLLRQQAIAPGEIDNRLRMQLAVDKIAKKHRIDTRSPQGNRQLTALFGKTSRAMGIDVNPRYGEWNTKQAALGSQREPWLRDLSGQRADRQQTM